MNELPALELPEAIAKADNLPSPPGVVVEVLRLTRDENAGIDELASVVSGDPAIASRLLKMSNSSMFATRGSSSGISRAGRSRLATSRPIFTATCRTGDPARLPARSFSERRCGPWVRTPLRCDPSEGARAPLFPSGEER